MLGGLWLRCQAHLVPAQGLFHVSCRCDRRGLCRMHEGFLIERLLWRKPSEK